MRRLDARAEAGEEAVAVVILDGAGVGPAGERLPWPGTAEFQGKVAGAGIGPRLEHAVELPVGEAVGRNVRGGLSLGAALTDGPETDRGTVTAQARLLMSF